MRVRFEAPSSPFAPDKLLAGVDRLRDAGWDVDDTPVHGLLRGRHAYLNGSDDERHRALEDALHGDADVVWLARGGYGLTRITSRVRAPKRAPIIIGFSDASALFGHLVASCVPCVHGPLATTLAAEPQESFAHTLAVLERRARGQGLPVRADGDLDLDIEGWLFAANLCVLAHLAGTPSAPDLRGAIVVLEEVGERPYRIDRALTQLHESGMLRGVRAVVVGHLTGCDEPMPPAGAPSTSASFGPTRDRAPAPLDVFRERLASMGIPMAHGLTSGHEAPNHALPLGVRARLTRDSLTLLEDLP